MGGAETRYEVIFKCLYGAFSPVASMQTGWCELKFDVFISDEFFEELGCFIIESMELWVESASLKETKNFGVGCFDGFFLSIGYGLCMNRVAVVIV